MEDLAQALEAELMDPAEFQALAPAQPAMLASQEGLGNLAMLETGLKILARKLELETALTKGLVAQTQPEEWIRSKAREGLIVAMPTKSALLKMARAIGFEIAPLPGLDLEPQEVHRDTEGGRVPGYSLKFRVRARALGGVWTELEATRWADEDFTGRQVGQDGRLSKRDGVAALSSDLKSATRSAAISKGVKELTGLGRVFDSQLIEAFGEKGLERCQKGHGFGSATERTAGKVAEGDVATGAKALWEDILRRTGGDEDAARGVLKEITSYPAYKKKDGGDVKAFAGVDSWQRITMGFALEQARKKLAAHPAFGDQAAGREPGED